MRNMAVQLITTTQKSLDLIRFDLLETIPFSPAAASVLPFPPPSHRSHSASPSVLSAALSKTQVQQRHCRARNSYARHDRTYGNTD